MITGIFTEQQLADMKTEFNELLRSTNRPGIENLINWLETGTDFYVAPASQMYHGAFPGGLLSHSLNVYHAAVERLCPHRRCICAGSLHIFLHGHGNHAASCRIGFHRNRIPGNGPEFRIREVDVG